MMRLSAGKNRAFTLIELAAVMLIMAIVAATVTLNLSGPKKTAQMNDTIACLMRFDDVSRQFSRNQDKALKMVFDLSNNLLFRLNEDMSSNETYGRKVSLPDGYRVCRVVTAGGNYDYGRPAIVCGSTGMTTSYGLVIEGPNQKKRWLLFAGLTGQCTEFDDETKFSKIWTTLRS